MNDDVMLPEALNQKAVYWAPLGHDDNGQPILDEPVEVSCRWDDVQEQFQDKAGNLLISNSRVLVDRDMKLEGFLWLGELSNIGSQFNPVANDGAYEIRKFAKNPDYDAELFVRTAIL